jgi:hypothetical protein
MEDETKRTGKRMEGLAVVEEDGEQASVLNKNRISNAAKEVWEKVTGFLAGKKVRRGEEPGSLVVCDEEKGNGNGGGLVDLADVGKELEDGVVVLLEENVDDDRFEVRSVGSESLSSRKNVGWDFLENLEGEERVEELDRKLEQNRKRKWEDDGEVKQRGLLNMVGWLVREKEGKSEKRWKRKVGRTVHDEEGRVVRTEDEEGIPLPKQFRLGLERKGVELNHASRARNNFGMNRRGLTGHTAGRGEKRNWIASFTRVGCLGCKTNGEGNHKGRTGNPLIMVIGDEATPMTVGFTKKDGGNLVHGCSKRNTWV